MAQANNQFPSSTPHPLSLKVLRLSRPSLATQTPLSATSFSPASLNIHPDATLAYPSTDPSSTPSPLTPLLTLPSSFGAAYVGETFACTLAINNDLEPPPSDDITNPNPKPNNPTITALQITASLQTPSNQAGFPLELQYSEEASEEASESESPTNNNTTTSFPPTTTLQKSLSHPLKEPGPHVLAVTVAYTSTSLDGNGVAVGSAARTFRKLYQFVAQPVLAVRSKIGVVGGGGSGGREKLKRWVLEAQVENVGGEGVVVERCFLKGGVGVWWEGGIGGGGGGGGGLEDGRRDGEGGGERFGGGGGGGGEGKPVGLRPRDVQQVMFVVEDREVGGGGGGGGGGRSGAPKALAQVEIDWRSAMGEKGRLTTGWLAARG